MIAIALFALLVGVNGTLDDDNVVVCYWARASGNVDHYDVYVSLDGGTFGKVGSSTTCGMAFYQPQVGSQVVVRVQAVDELGDTGPMSKASEPVWRVVQKDPPGRAISE